MAIHVDLSVAELQPTSVLSLMEAHVRNRPPEDILFKVSKRTLDLYRRRRPKGAVTVSPDEVDKLNEFLGKSHRAQDYALWKKHKCSKCKRVLTFYDVFESGRKRHGDEYVRQVLGGDEYHLHIQKRGQALQVDCKACGLTNSLVRAGYDGPEY
jgi:hypothetical protein